MNQLELMLQTIVATIKENLWLLGGGILGLWLLQGINYLFGYQLNQFGIIPRRWYGLTGIFCSPFLHGNATHLFFNTIPLLSLATFILIGGRDLFYWVTITIILLSGLFVWLFGRLACHIGASSLIMGYWGYLLINAYHQPSFMAIALAAVSLYYFGGLFFSLFPSSQQTISWEGHLFGFFSGLIANYLFPLPVPY